MLHKRSALLVAAALFISSLTIASAFNKGFDSAARARGQTATIEEVARAGNKAIREGDWASAESHFREAARLAPTQGFWRIQLVLVLGQEKKWKAAFDEMDPLLKSGAVDWLLTVNQKLPEGKVAFVNTETFGNEQKGITRYVEAVRAKKKTNSISSDIGVKLDAFAKAHKIALMYDVSKFKGLPFESGGTTDVTSEFIAYYNGSAYVQPYGTLYLYRGIDTHDYGQQITVLNPEAVVYLDGEEFVSMPERTFIGFKVPVGRYLLHLTRKSARRVLDVVAGATYYLRIEQIAYPNFDQWINDVEEKGALEEIRRSYTLKEKKIKLSRFEAIRKNPG